MKAHNSASGSAAATGLDAPHLSESQKAEIRHQLARVLRSPAFRGSKRSQDFLHYIVEHQLGGSGSSLKGRNIGVDVFGRDPAYDPNVDAIVRVSANELRKRLAQYYVETEHAEELRIEIPLGTYAPEFHRMAAQQESPKALHRARYRHRWNVALAAAVVVVLAALGAVALLWWGTETPSLDAFWDPVLQSPNPVLICSGHPVVYFLSSRVHNEYRAKKGINAADGPYVVELEPNATVQGRDIVPVREQYVGVGDALTASRLQVLLVQREKPAQIRFGHDISFSDLRNAPAILIGAYSNRWTLQMTSELRYVFVMRDGVKAVEDRLAKDKRWALPGIAPDGHTAEDYAIVSRVFDSQSGETILAAAGITQYGTRAAGEFLTTESLMAAAVRTAPAGWARRNLQVVLHTRVVGETPAPPEIVATHFW